MKTAKKYWILFGIAGVLLIFIFVATIFYDNSKIDPESEDAALASYLMEQDDIMTNMISTMAITPTTNADLDYLYGMIPHHQASIRMSESYLNYGGSNRKLKKIAKEIIKEQTKEVEEMEKTAARLERSAISDTTTEEAYLSAYDEIMSERHYTKHGTSSTQNLDQAFAQGMILHHEMAVKMAEAILANSTTDDIHDFAEDVLELQQEEIAQLKTAAYLQDSSLAGY